MSDSDGIHRLNTDEMGYEFSLNETKEKLLKLINSESDKIFVAIIGDEVVGYVHANDYDLIYAPHMKNIMGIAVAEKYKRNGIGKSLLSEVEKWAKETGANGVRLV